MKTKFLLAFFVFISFVLHGQDSQWKLLGFGGIDLGGAIPVPVSAAADDAQGMPLIKPGIGLELQYDHKERWRFAGGLFYHNSSLKAIANVVSQPYWSDDRSYATYFSGEAHTHIELQQLEMPLSVQYKLNKKWSLLLGGYFSYMLKGSFDTDGRNGWISTNKSDTDSAPLPGIQNVSYSLDNEIDNYDLGLMTGYQYALWKRFLLWGRFSVGLKSIFKPDFTNIDYDMYQFRFSMGLAYVLF